MPKAEPPKSIGDLFPHLTPEELADAERRIAAYAALAFRVFERVESDPEAWATLVREIEKRAEAER